MRVFDYGRIFIPQDHGLDYCKSPQALVLEDRVRIFFSYCVKDGSKLKSRVGFVDLDKGFRSILKVSKEVISDGDLGTFDEHGIFPFSPFVDHNGDICALTTGWNRKQSVSTETAIGLARSEDGGDSFARVGSGPVLAADLNEPFLVCDGFMLKRQSCDYVMFYIYGTGWDVYEGSDVPERTYKIAMAYSDDLLNWKRDHRQIIPEKDKGEAQALPCVLKFEDRWHMFFCYRHTVGFRDDPEKGYRLGYAYSKNLKDWVREDDALPTPDGEWCKDMQCYPNAFMMDGQVFLLYNGNRFGKEGFGLLRLEDLN